MDRTQLLRRWSELAPEEYADANPWPDSDFGTRAELLLALIEAVEKRGWWLTLESGYRQEAGYTVTVGSGHENFLAQEHPEPCDAMLQAYCAALQAGKERSE